MAMRGYIGLLGGAAATVVLAWAAFPAHAKPARCFTTDDGEYACEFRALDPNGSFQISAPGKPTFSLWMESRGVAAAFANFGDRDVALPGQYHRRKDDPACWANPDTDTRICAR